MRRKESSHGKVLKVLTGASCDFIFALWKLRASSDGATLKEVADVIVPPVLDHGTIHQRVRRLRKSNEEFFAANPQDLKWFSGTSKKLKQKWFPDWSAPVDWQFKTRRCVRSSNTQEGYQMKHHATIVFPRTAYVCLKIKERYENEYEPLYLENYSTGAKQKQGLIETFSEATGESKESIIDDLTHSLRQRYLYPYSQTYRLEGKLPKKIIPAPRLDYELGYIKYLAQEYENNLRDIPRISNNPVDQTYSESLHLVKEEVDLLEVLWEAQHLNQQPQLTTEEICHRLKKDKITVQQLLENLGKKKKNIVETEGTIPTKYRIRYYIVQWPPDAKVICDLISKESFPPKREEYILSLSQKLLHQDPKKIELDMLSFAEAVGFIEPAPHNPGRIWATQRARETQPYLERIANRLDEWLERNEEGRKWKMHALAWSKRKKKI